MTNDKSKKTSVLSGFSNEEIHELNQRIFPESMSDFTDKDWDIYLDVRHARKIDEIRDDEDDY